MSLLMIQQMFNQDSTKAFVLTTAKYTLACTSLHLALRPVVRKSPAIKPQFRGDWINRCVALIHALVSGVMCTYALLYEEPFASYTHSLFTMNISQHNYFVGTSAILAKVLPLTVGYMVYDLGVMSVDSEVYMPLLVVHHLFSIILFPIALLSQSCHYHVLQLLSTEMTSLVLHPTMFFLPQYGLKGTPIHTASGLLLIAVFTLFRFLPIPLLIYSFFGSINHYYELPSSGVKWAIAIGFPIPPLMNLFWYHKLLVGAIKALGIIGKDKKKNDHGKKD
mmetsp:Transcript_24848/g.32356  ORF Transcript_24848/g.32356 Transcript_24848/m.32356 type:complete len:278 (-) Transcript_24848:144-977(-)